MTRFFFGHLGRIFGNPHCTLALYVRVPPNRADARTGFADIAAQQQQIDEHLHVFHAMTVLGHAHAVDHHDPLTARVHHGRRFQRAATEPGTALQFHPWVALDVCQEGVDTVGMLGNEVMIKYRFSPRCIADRSIATNAFTMPMTAAVSPPIDT